MSPTKRRNLGIAIFAAGLALFWAPAQEYFAIDRCIDRGGSYDYAGHLCDFKQSHPVDGSVPSTFLIVLGLGGMGVGMGLVASGMAKRHAP